MCARGGIIKRLINMRSSPVRLAGTSCRRGQSNNSVQGPEGLFYIMLLAGSTSSMMANCLLIYGWRKQQWQQTTPPQVVCCLVNATCPVTAAGVECGEGPASHDEGQVECVELVSYVDVYIIQCMLRCGGEDR